MLLIFVVLAWANVQKKKSLILKYKGPFLKCRYIIVILGLKHPAYRNDL